MDPEKNPIVERAKEPSSWLGALILGGGIAGQALGKPVLASPEFWASVLNVVAGVGLIFTPQKKKKSD